MSFTFNGVTVGAENQEKMKFNEAIDTGTEVILESEQTFHHSEPDLEFDYKYFIQVINMFEATGDKQFENEPYSIEVHMVIDPEDMSDKVQGSIENFTGGYVKYLDAMFTGYSVRVLYDNHQSFDEDSVDPAVENIQKTIVGVDRLRGFFLDKFQNRIGSTGWDYIEEFLGGENAVTVALSNRTLE